MRTRGLWGLAALLVAGLAVTVARAADEDDDAPKKEPAFKFGHTGLFGKTHTDEPATPEPAKNAKATPPTAETQTVRREREFNAYLRRMDACDRLMDIAIATNNDAMQHQVEQLSERVWAVYQQNTAITGTSKQDGDDSAAGSGRPANRSASAADAGRE